MLASPKIAQFFLKIVRAKLNALLIGTTGVGIVNQLSEVNNKLGNFSILSLNLGAKKLIVDNNNKENFENIPSIITLYSFIMVILALAFYFLGLIFYDQLSSFFLGDKAKKYFLIVFLFFPLIPLTSIPKAVLAGLQKFKYLALSEITVILLSFLSFVPLIYFFKTTGAVINIAITLLLTFLIFSYFVFIKTAKEREQHFINLNKFKFNKKHIKELTTISGIGSVLGAYSIFVELSIRGLIATHLGMDKLGIYAPVIAWSGFFSSLFLPSLFQYIFPKYGECKTNQELSNVVNDAFRLLTFMIIPFVLLIISLRHILIPLLYSSDFSEASHYLPIHFIGIFFWTWMRILKQIFIPTGRIKKLIPFAVAESTLYFGIVFFLIDKIGLWAWCLRYSLVPLLMFFSFFLFLRKEVKLIIKSDNIILMIYAILGSFLVYFVSSKSDYSVVPALLLIMFLFFFLKKSEKENIKYYLLKIRFIHK